MFRVVDLFSGIATARLALDRLGIRPTWYEAYETNPHAIKVAHANYPDIKHRGDIFDVRIDTMPYEPDLIIGGPPCQPFSVAGVRQMFDDPRSRCVSAFIDTVYQLRPKYFLMENVPMPIECIDKITNAIGVEPLWLDSAGFSAQRRLRVYWTNIPFNEFPAPNKLCLKDILEYNIDHDWRDMRDFGSTLRSRIRSRRAKDGAKSYTLCKNSRSLGAAGMTTIVNEEDPNLVRILTVTEAERLQTLPDGYTNAIHYHTVRRALIGNAFTAKVIEAILGNMRHNGKLIKETGKLTSSSQTSTQALVPSI